MINIALPREFTLRPSQVDDLPAVTELVRLCENEFYGAPETTLVDMRTYWQTPDFNLVTDSWVVSSPEGQLIAYAFLMHRQHARLYTECEVHPAYRNRGIGTSLLQVAEARAREHILAAQPGVRVSLGISRSQTDTIAQHLVVKHGYVFVRSFWRMAIELNEAPPIAQWAEGIQVRTYVPDMERAVYDADEEAFEDHWGHIPDTFERWQHWTVKREGFDPSLWFLAMDGDEIAGFALCKNEENGGWVHVLGVRRPWRRKGVALALLHHAFAEFQRRTIQKVYLGVDAQSLTGAPRLYERAGMHVDQQINRYEKELRAGKELSTQSLAD